MIINNKEINWITPEDIELEGETVLTVADPFIGFEKNKFIIFFELLTDKRKCIGVLVSDDGSVFSFAGIAVDKTKVNFSFPYYFRLDDEYFMFPEITFNENPLQNSNIYYKTMQDKFPFGWEEQKELFEFNEANRVTDKIVFLHQNRWYMIYSVGNSKYHELKLACTDGNKINGEWSVHTQEVLSKSLTNFFWGIIYIFMYKLVVRFGLRKAFDNLKFPGFFLIKLLNLCGVEAARPAGAIDVSDGKLTVYVQYQGHDFTNWDIRARYGFSIKKMIINELTDSKVDYTIEKDYFLKPFSTGHAKDKIHTYNTVSVNERM